MVTKERGGGLLIDKKESLLVREGSVDELVEFQVPHSSFNQVTLLLIVLHIKNLRFHLRI